MYSTLWRITQTEAIFWNTQLTHKRLSMPANVEHQIAHERSKHVIHQQSVPSF